MRNGSDDRRQLRILLVEDDQVDRVAVESLIEKERLPYELVTAATVVEAEEQLRRGQLDLALIDHKLPDGTGLDVLARAQEVPSVFISGTEDLGTVVSAMKAGACDYLTKDPGREYLKLLPSVIDRAMDRRNLELRLRHHQQTVEELEYVYRGVKAIGDVNQLIVREPDPEHLVQGICDTLVRSGGYHSAWLVQFDDRQKPLRLAESGLGAGFESVRKNIECGDLPACARAALTQPDPVVIDDPTEACSFCPLAGHLDEHSCMTMRLGHTGKIYGVLTAAVPRWYAKLQRDRNLFAEVALDAAFALYAIETERLRDESEQRFRHFFEDSPVYSYMVSPEGLILEANRAAREVLGYTREELIGQPLINLYAPESRDWARQTFNNWKETGILQDVELTISGRSGNQRTVLLDATSVTNLQGDIIYSISIQRDITERRESEKRLLETQQRLRALTAELALSEERERRRIAAALHDNVGQTMALAKIRLGGICQRADSSSLAGPLNELREHLSRAIQEMRSLIFQLSPPVLYELGLEPTVEWLLEQMKSQHAIDFEFHDDGRGKPLADDLRVLLYRAVRELIFNVVKHAEARLVKVSITREENVIWIRVADDGRGFQPAVLEMRPGKPQGFGLFSIRERLGNAGGTISIDSAPGKGTRVMLAVPLLPAPDAARGEGS